MTETFSFVLQRTQIDGVIIEPLKAIRNLARFKVLPVRDNNSFWKVVPVSIFCNLVPRVSLLRRVPWREMEGEGEEEGGRNPDPVYSRYVCPGQLQS